VRFDKKKFAKAKFEPRIEEVSVPALAAFFDEGSKPVFKVRGLTGEEMARCNEAQAKAKNIGAVVEALVGSNQKDKVTGLREALGMSEDSLPEDLAKRIEMVRYGCVDPEFDQQGAAKLFQVAPVDGFSLSNKIMILSGQGMTVGEPSASGKTRKSKQPSTSDTPEAV